MILITGGAGYLGTVLTKMFLKRGEKVRVLDRPGIPEAKVRELEGLGAEVALGDISEKSSLKGRFDGVRAVLHLAAIILTENPLDYERINVQGGHNVYHAAVEAGCEHLVKVSSISATYPEPLSDYGRSKKVGEDFLMNQDKIHWTIIRPTLIVSETGALEYRTFHDFVKKCPKFVPLPNGGRALKNPVWVEDINQGMIDVTGNPRCYNKAYALCGGENISLAGMVEAMNRAFGWNKQVVSVPGKLVEAGIALTKPVSPKKAMGMWQKYIGLERDATPDWSSNREDFGYAPRGFSEFVSRIQP